MKKVRLGFYVVKFDSGALCHGTSLVVIHDKSTLRTLALINQEHVYQTVYLLKEHAELKQFSPLILDEAEPTFNRIKQAI